MDGSHRSLLFVTDKSSSEWRIPSDLSLVIASHVPSLTNMTLIWGHGVHQTVAD